MSEVTDVDAFNELYAATFTRVLAYCRRRCHHSSDADDAVAETYLVAWQKLDRARNADSTIAWLYAVAYRVLSNQRRSSSRGERLRTRLRDQPRPELRTDPAETVAADSEVALAFEALGQLSSREQELIRLAAFEELSYAEIATVTGMRIGAVRSGLYRARKRLEETAKRRTGRDSEPPADTNKQGGGIPDPDGGEAR